MKKILLTNKTKTYANFVKPSCLDSWDRIMSYVEKLYSKNFIVTKVLLWGSNCNVSEHSLMRLSFKSRFEKYLLFSEVSMELIKGNLCIFADFWTTFLVLIGMNVWRVAMKTNKIDVDRYSVSIGREIRAEGYSQRNSFLTLFTQRKAKASITRQLLLDGIEMNIILDRTWLPRLLSVCSLSLLSISSCRWNNEWSQVWSSCFC